MTLLFPVTSSALDVDDTFTRICVRGIPVIVVPSGEISGTGWQKEGKKEHGKMIMTGVLAGA